MADILLEHFNQEVLEDIGTLFMVMGELQKSTKKAKRINEQIKTSAKEAVMTFLLAVMSVYTFEMERE